MSFIAKSTAPRRPKTKNIRMVSLLLAAIITVMAVAQLFTFERFGEVIVGMGLPVSATWGQVIAAFIVTLEVLALPFLLFMRLSHLMRVISVVSGWLVVKAWFILSIWVNIVTPASSNTGLLGATVPVAVGWWMVFFTLGLVILDGWIAWGMWPLRKALRK